MLIRLNTVTERIVVEVIIINYRKKNNNKFDFLTNIGRSFPSVPTIATFSFLTFFFFLSIWVFYTHLKESEAVYLLIFSMYSNFIADQARDIPIPKNDEFKIQHCIIHITRKSLILLLISRRITKKIQIIFKNYIQVVCW